MKPIEHFVTLFDSTFLPIGLALYRSLAARASPMRLWVLCMDDDAHEQLSRLNLPDLTPIRLTDVETPQLLAAKARRSRAEYCWTLASFTFDAVFVRDPNVQRVTYLDADLMFFDDPRHLLRELDNSGKHVLITEHAYAPQYDQTPISGRFCVQFITFDRSEAATRIRHRWQNQCLESCSADYSPGKFGDQVYLEEWPALFEQDVHILEQTDRTLAPWNVAYVSRKTSGRLQPVFYHFHGFRLIAPRRARLYYGYRVGPQGRALYDAYLIAIGQALSDMAQHGIAPRPVSLPPQPWGWLGTAKHALLRTQAFADVP